MQSRYHGESYGKKLARCAFWGDIVSDRLRMPGEKIVILASEHGGDVACLLGHGVPLESIVAVDQDAAALARCADAWPGLDVRQGDVADVVEGMAERPIAVFLDFCGSVSHPMIYTCARVMRRIQLQGFLGIAFLRARENDWGKKLAGFEPMRPAKHGKKSERRMVFDEEHGNYSSARKQISLLPGKSDAMSGAFARMASVWTPMMRAYQDRCAVPIALLAYQSGGEDRRGSPMGIVTMRVIRRVGAAPGSTTMEMAWKKLGGRGGIRLFDFAGQGLSDVRQWVLSRDDDPLIHLKMNLPKMRVAAWRAHRTMGTYDQEAGGDAGGKALPRTGLVAVRQGRPARAPDRPR
jgi:hypothetical protein